jgi:hypothetical protein
MVLMVQFSVSGFCILCMQISSPSVYEVLSCYTKVNVHDLNKLWLHAFALNLWVIKRYHPCCQGHGPGPILVRTVLAACSERSDGSTPMRSQPLSAKSEESLFTLTEREG